MANREFGPNEEELGTKKIDVNDEYKDFVPDDFRSNPFSYFEEYGKNIKSGDIKYDENGVVREDPSAVKELPTWRDLDGKQITAIGKRVNIEKAKVGESGDPFYEYRVMEYVRSRNLPCPAPIAKASEGNSHLIIMERVPGLTWSQKDELRLAGYSEADLDVLLKDAQSKMEDLKQQFQNAGIIRTWKLNDMVFDLDIESKVLHGVTPVDWERTRIQTPGETEADPELIENLKKNLSEVKGEFQERDYQRIVKAIELALTIHADQRGRPDGPYVNHIIRVVTRVLVDFKVRDPNIIMASALHDSVEDQASKLSNTHKKDVSEREQALKYIKLEFGSRVAEIVNAVSNPEEMDKLEVDEKNSEYVGHLTKAIEDPEVCLVKLSDFLDNGLRILYIKDISRQYYLAKKYLPVYSTFTQRLGRTDIQLPDDIKSDIIEKLSKAGDFAKRVTEK